MCMKAMYGEHDRWTVSGTTRTFTTDSTDVHCDNSAHDVEHEERLMLLALLLLLTLTTTTTTTRQVMTSRHTDVL